MIVSFVLETESKLQLVSVLKVLSIMVKKVVQFVLTNVTPVLTPLTIVYLVPQKETHHQSVQLSHQRLDPLKLKISQ